MAPSLTAHRTYTTSGASRTLAVVAGAVLVAVFVVLGVALDPLPEKVDEVTVVNPHPWAVQVDVREDDGSGRLSLGTVPRESDASFLETTDQGRRWVVSFAYDGTSVERTYDRSELEADDWTITVPAELGDLLSAAGTFETPSGSA
jgi:hypothetical protein